MPPATLSFPVFFLLTLPLLAFVGIGLSGRRFNNQAGWAASAGTLIGLLLTIFFLSPDSIHTVHFDWMTAGNFTFHITFRIDYLGWLMLLLVHFVAFLVQLYSIAYMRHDPARYRYFAFIQLF